MTMNIDANTLTTTTLNNTTLNKPQHITSLATGGILIHVEVRSWSATQQDEEVTHEVTDAKDANANSGRFIKNLMANVPEHKALIRDRADWYNWTKAMSYDWAGSWRYLPKARVPVFMEQFKQRYGVTEKLVNDLIGVYNSRVADMAFNSQGLGKMFKASDYPTEAEVRGKYSVTLNTADVPQGDFRCAIANELADDLHKHYVQQNERIKNAIVAEQASQFVEVMQAIAKACDVRTVVDDAGNTKTRRGKIYESTIERALEYCETFKTFNLDNDPKLEAARAELQQILQGVSVDKLRDSDGMRIVVKDGINDVLSRFGMTL
jgi:hypothetical protein